MFSFTWKLEENKERSHESGGETIGRVEGNTYEGVREGKEKYCEVKWIKFYY